MAEVFLEYGEYRVRPGRFYLVEEPKPLLSYQLVDELLLRGIPALVIARSPPRQVWEIPHPAACKVLRLTKQPGENVIDPKALGILAHQITLFLQQEARSVVLLDGVEYLITQNDFDAFMKFLNNIVDIVLDQGSVFLVAIDPRALAPQQVALMERDADVLRPT